MVSAHCLAFLDLSVGRRNPLRASRSPPSARAGAQGGGSCLRDSMVSAEGSPGLCRPPIENSVGRGSRRRTCFALQTALVSPNKASHHHLTWCFNCILSNNSRYLLAQTVEPLPAMQETWVRSLGREDPLEKEMATHSSILAWRIPWRDEPGGV